MAGNTDQRVLQLSFENRQFERNIAKSKKSIEELKQAMDFEKTSSGLKKFTSSFNALSFDKLTDNIQKLTDKFTGLGTASELVLSQIRRKIEQTAAQISNFVDSMTVQQIHAGMQKYGELNKSVQTIMAATGRAESEVYAVLSRLNDYTDQTSYNFTDMASNIGKFTSVGIKLEDAERMMEGIANWAARSGAGIAEASRAMYNLSQAMGVGKLTKIDWKSIENAGMATREFKEQLIQAGLAAGTLEKKTKKVNGKVVETIVTAKSLGKQIEVTADNTAETLSKGWATKNVLGMSLEKYYWEELDPEAAAEPMIKLAEAQKEAYNKAFGEKDSVVSATDWKAMADVGIWTDENKQKLLDLAVASGKLTAEGEKNGKTLYKTTNKTGKKIEFTIDEVEKSLKSGWFTKELGDSATTINELAKASFEAAQKCLTFSDVLGAWKDQISTGWMNSFKIIFGELSDSMAFFSAVCNKVSDSLSDLISIRNDILTSWADQGGRENLVDMLVGEYDGLNNTGAFGLLDMLDGLKKTFVNGLADFFGIFAGGDKAILFHDPENGLKWMSAWIGIKLQEITQKVSDFGRKIHEFLEGEVEVNGEVKTRTEMIQDIVKGVVGALAIAYVMGREAVNFITSLASDFAPAIDAILGFLSELGLSIYGTATDAERSESITTFFMELHEELQPMTTALSDVIVAFADLLSAILGFDRESGTTSNAITTIAKAIKTVAGTISKIAAPILHFIADFIYLIRDLFTNSFDEKTIAAFGGKVKAAFNKMISEMPEAVQKAYGYLKKAYAKLTSEDSPLKKLFDSIVGFFTGDEENAGKENILTTVKGWFTKISAKFKELVTSLQNGTFLETAQSWLEQLGTKFKELWASIQELFTGTGTSETDQKGVLTRISDWITEIFPGLKSFFENLSNTFVGWGQTGSFSTAMSKILLIIGAGGFLFIIGKTIFQAIKLAKEVAGGIKNLTEILTEGIDWKKILKGKEEEPSKFEDFVGNFVKFAGAVAILTACVVTLGSMKIEAAIQGIAAIALLLAALGGMSVWMKKVYEDFDPKNALSMFLGMYAIALSAAVVVKALLPLAKLQWDELLRMGSGLVAVYAFLALLSIQMTKTEMGFEKASGLLAIAGAVWLLVRALMPLAKMQWPQLITMFGSLLVILGLLTGFMWAIHKTSMEGKGMTQVIALAAGIAVLIIALKRVANMRIDQLVKMFGSLTVILGLFIGFMWAINKVSMAGKGMGQMAALAAAIAILIFSLKSLANLKWEQLGKMFASLFVTLGLLVAFMALTRKLTMAGSGMGQMAALAAAIALLVISLRLIANLEIGHLIQALAGLAVVMVMMYIFIKKVQDMTIKGTGMVGLIAFAFSILLLMAPLLILANMDFGKMMKGIFGLILIMGSVSLLCLALSKIDIKQALGGLLLMLSMMGVLLVFAAVMFDLKDIPNDKIWAFVGAIAALTLGLAAAALIAKAIGISGILLLIALIAGVLGVIALMAKVVIGSVASAFRNAAGDLIIIADLMKDFTTRVDETDESGLDKAKRLIGGICEIIADMAKVTLSVESTQEFQTAMAHLLLATDEIVKFNRRISSLDESGGTDKAKTIVDKFRDLFDNHLAGFDAYIGYSNSFYSAIYNLGSAFDYFNSMTQTLGDPEENNGLKMIKELAACAPNLDTIYKMDLDTFERQLARLGGAMIVYAQGAASVEGSEITADTDIGGAIILLQKISESLSSTGGFSIPENMPDEGALTDFGVELAALAGALVAFEQAGAGLGNGTAQALDTLDFFVRLKNKLNETSFSGSALNAVIQAFKGDDGEFIKQDELTTFGEDIAKLGSSMAHFAEATQVVDAETKEVKPIDFSKATDALTVIAELPNKMPPLKGPLDELIGKHATLTSLTGEIEGLGTAIGEFYSSTTVTNNGVPEAMDFTNVIGFLNSVVDAANTLNKIRIPGFNLESLFFKSGMDFGTLSGQLAQLGKGLNELSGSLSGKKEGGEAFDSSAATDAMTMIEQSVVPLMQTLANRLPQIGGLGDIISTAFNGRKLNMKDIGDQLGYLGTGLGNLGKGLADGGWDAGDTKGVAAAFSAIDQMLAVMLKIESVNSITDDAYYSLDDLAEFLDSLTTGIGDEVQPIAPKIAAFMTGLSEELGKFITSSDELGMVMDRMEAFRIFTEGLNNLVMTDTTMDWSIIGSKMTGDIAKTITDGTTDVITSVTGLINGMYTAADTTQNWTTIGLNIIAGIQEGIRQGKSDLINEVVYTALEAYVALKEEFGIESPSKVFAQLGGFMAAGLAKGMTDSTDIVAGASETMGQTALQTAGDIIAMISKIMEDENGGPTITPVLDLSNVDAGMAGLDRSLQNKSIRLNTESASGFAGRTARSIDSGREASEGANTVNLDGIYSRMAELGDRIMSLGTAISNMKLVMDNNALAGGVTNGVNQRLGRQAFYDNRNN